VHCWYRCEEAISRPQNKKSGSILDRPNGALEAAVGAVREETDDYQSSRNFRHLFEPPHYFPTRKSLE